MRVLTRFGFVACTMLGMVSQYGHAETRQVGEITWNTSEPTVTAFESWDLPKDRSQLIFVRFMDSLPFNINVAVDNYHQTSLQSDSLSAVMVCTGSHDIKLQSAANNLKDIASHQYPIETATQQTYYYQVKMNDADNVLIVPLGIGTTVDGQPLLDYLAQVPRQSHQISRVPKDCIAKLLAPEQIKVGNNPEFVTNKMPEALVELPSIQTKIQSERFAQTQNNYLEQTVDFINKPITLDIQFEFDSAEIIPQYYSDVAKLAEFMTVSQASTLIEGHTDDRGSMQYNENLSRRRATAVKNFMVNEYAIEPSKLKTIGLGESRPIATNDTAAGRQKNRRVTAIILDFDLTKIATGHITH